MVLGPILFIFYNIDNQYFKKLNQFQEFLSTINSENKQVQI